MRFAGLVLALAISLSLTACQDTKARQENEQLKAQLSQLEKDNGDLQDHVDALTQENTELKAKKKSKHKHRSSSKAGNQN